MGHYHWLKRWDKRRSNHVPFTSMRGEVDGRPRWKTIFSGWTLGRRKVSKKNKGSLVPGGGAKFVTEKVAFALSTVFVPSFVQWWMKGYDWDSPLTLHFKAIKLKFDLYDQNRWLNNVKNNSAFFACCLPFQERNPASILSQTTKVTGLKQLFSGAYSVKAVQRMHAIGKALWSVHHNMSIAKLILHLVLLSSAIME